MPKINFTTFLLKILAAGSGSTIGTLFLLLMFVLSSSLLGQVTEFQEGQYISPIFIFVLLMMIFLATTIGNLLSVFLISLTEREKYKRRSSAIYQIFIISLIMFVLMVPVYFLTYTIDINLVAYAIGLHIILSAQVSALVLEVIANSKYSLLGIYGVTFSILLSAAALAGLIKLVGSENPTILLFAALPIVWVSIAIVQSIATMIYGWISDIYDKDFLAVDTEYGDDYGKEIIEKKTPEEQDEEGAKFLRKNN